MSRRAALALVAGAVVVVLLGVWLGWRTSRRPSEPGESEQQVPAAVQQQELVTLFFPGLGTQLGTEERLIPSLSPQAKIRTIVEALLSGPAAEGLSRPLPDDVTLGGVYLGTGAVAYVDLHRPEGAAPPPMGSREELLMTYSLVNSVVLNVQEVERVSLLWNGAQRPSLGGHLDTGGPLAARPQLAAGRS